MEYGMDGMDLIYAFLVVTKEPYVLQEKGWGEFDMRIVLNFANNVATEVLLFDLSFMQSSYSVIRTVVSWVWMGSLDG